MQPNGYRPVGPTYVLDITNVQHGGVLIEPAMGETAEYCAFVNTDANDVMMAMYPNGGALPTLTFPADGSHTGDRAFPLHAGATGQPMIVRAPAGTRTGQGFYVTGIGAVAGPQTVYVTPLGNI